MLDDRHKGWQSLVDRLQCAASKHNIIAYVKTKNGQLAVELPRHAPDELFALADQIEQRSDVICQRCSDEPAHEFLNDGWVMKLCTRCHLIVLSEIDHEQIR